MQKEEGNVIMPEWVSNWELPSDEYEMYRKTYERYQNSLENINKAHNEVVQSKQALEKVKSLSEELSVAVKIRDEYKKSFAEESKTKSVENELKKRTGNIVDFEGKYTSLKMMKETVL
jgi:phage shock protein A